MAYEIRTEQKFTDVGMVGVALFIGGPIASAICYGWYLSQLGLDSFDSNAAAAGFFMAIGSIAFFVGCILVLIGRTQVHTVRKVEERQEASQQLWS